MRKDPSQLRPFHPECPLCLHETRLGLFEEDTTDFLCRFGLDRKITFANRRFRTSIDESAPSLFGKTFPVQADEQDLPALNACLSDLSAAEVPPPHTMPVHFRVRSHTGEVRFQKWMIRLIPGHGANPPEFQAVGRDFTREVGCGAAEANLKRLQETSREITHDLNNLLLQVTGATESALRHLEDTPVVVKRLNQVLATLNRIQGLNDRLHTSNRATATGAFDPVRISREVLAEVFSNEEVQWTVQSAEPGYRVIGDGREMERVFLNLFQNARDAMGGGGRLAVSFETRVSEPGNSFGPERHVYISISDSGCGMSAENLARAFKVQFTTKRNGHGIGLSIVRKIICRLDGTITLRSTPGEGTTFEIELPLANPD